MVTLFCISQVTIQRGSQLLPSQIGCPGQCKDKFGSHILRADHIDGFPVILDDLLYDGQAQAGASFVFASGGI